MSTLTTTAKAKTMQSLVQWDASRWVGIFLVIYGLWVFLPFLAPVFMHIGWSSAGKAIYFIYSFFCHQLPERSFFLFGQKPMYLMSEIQAAWQNTINPQVLRKFIGNETMGWKVAWSDRMISFYTSVWIFAVLWVPFRRKVKPLPWWGFALFLLPIALDGGTHFISDFAGIGQGFRDTNLWLVTLTHNALPASFYVGDVLGSFNSWMRLITGPLAGLDIVWLAFPYVAKTEALNEKLEKLSYGQILEQIKSENPHSSH
jgi:uncharacterized membrane protein